MARYRGQRPSSSYYATDAQIAYLRHLLDLAFARRVDHGLCHDRHHLDRVTKVEASGSISKLKSLLEIGDR